MSQLCDMSPLGWIHQQNTKVRWFHLLALLLSAGFTGCWRQQTETTGHSAAVCPAPRSPSELTALERYVPALDTNYSFPLVRSIAGNEHTTFLLEMTSQAC